MHNKNKDSETTSIGVILIWVFLTEGIMIGLKIMNII